MVSEPPGSVANAASISGPPSLHAQISPAAVSPAPVSHMRAHLQKQVAASSDICSSLFYQSATGHPRFTLGTYESPAFHHIHGSNSTPTQGQSLNQTSSSLEVTKFGKFLP